MTAVFFYLFAGVAIASALMVIASRNPIHSVLYLILAFFNAAGLFLLMGAEFLAMILVVVYVGAVMVLFLFVTMLLDVDYVELRQGFLQYLPVGMLIGLVFLVELVLVVGGWVVNPTLLRLPITGTPEQVTNTEAIGRVLYTQYFYFFQASGMILLVAMVGAIVLTLRDRPNIKRQNISRQVARQPSDGVALRKVRSRQGV
jgi:NADH-quinone oxidoreductase subunit J